MTSIVLCPPRSRCARAPSSRRGAPRSLPSARGPGPLSHVARGHFPDLARQRGIGPGFVRKEKKRRPRMRRRSLTIWPLFPIPLSAKWGCGDDDPCGPRACTCWDEGERAGSCVPEPRHKGTKRSAVAPRDRRLSDCRDHSARHSSAAADSVADSGGQTLTLTQLDPKGPAKSGLTLGAGVIAGAHSDPSTAARPDLPIKEPHDVRVRMPAR